jgi:hypothetical protein
MSLRSRLRRFRALAPIILLISFSGCFIGRYLLGIRMEHLGAAVAVPVMVAFLISRILVLVVPDPFDGGDDLSRAPWPRVAMTIVTFVGAATFAVFVPSSAIYRLVYLRALSYEALRVGVWGASIAAITLIISFLGASLRKIPFGRAASYFRHWLVVIFWHALRTPASLATHVLGPPTVATSNHPQPQ